MAAVAGRGRSPEIPGVAGGERKGEELTRVVPGQKIRRKVEIMEMEREVAHFRWLAAHDGDRGTCGEGR